MSRFRSSLPSVLLFGMAFYAWGCQWGVSRGNDDGLLLGLGLHLAAGSASTLSVSDTFDGTGPLLQYTTNNATSLPDVARQAGRYRAHLTDNSGDITLHYHAAQGRLDAKRITFPFDYIARNVGIGTAADSQTAPGGTGDPYIFAGVQVHVIDLDTASSSHVVVGHRGGVHFTIEGKNTVNGVSTVNDAGFNIVPSGRADIRIVGSADRTLTVYWQQPNQASDAWTLYRGTGSLPGTAPTFGAEVYIGLITYAAGAAGVPFAGTCDEIEASQ